jgi:cytochrome c oxidase cbb3-type subunit 3
LLVSACEREARPFHDLTAATRSAERPVGTTLVIGGSVRSSQASPFQENAFGIAEGKRLFDAYNCSGCHAHGGGGMGPALMDDKWIYGHAAANIFETIVEGRPNGMPSFRARIPDVQVWQLVAFIQSMSGHAPIDSLPGRRDHLSGGDPENLRPAVPPVEAGHQ